MSGTYSTADVASHNKADNLWIIVDQDVYDLTKFQEEHPGGKKSMYSPPSYGSFKLTADSPPESRRQGRQQAILEVPQRIHP